MPTYTDAQLVKIEKQITKIYSRSQQEVEAKWNIYMERSEKRIEKAKTAWEKAFADANVDSGKVEELRLKYKQAMYNATFRNNYYKEMVEGITDTLTHTNEVALAYVNDKMPPIYTHAYNEFADEEISGYSFHTVNEHAVRNLIKNGDKSLLPQKTVNIPKDKAWNMKNINSQMLQGILQGESVDKIAKRLQNVTDMNRNSAIRNARTMATGSESKGHMDSFDRAVKDGVIMKKVWVSAHDGHTRDWHLDLNGKEVDVDEPFDSEFGEISYPGDPSAHPCNVYNCRCSIRAKVLGFKWNKNTTKNDAKTKTAKANENKSLTEESLIKRDYGTDFAKFYGGEYYNAMCDLVDKSSNVNLKTVWQQYQIKIGAKDPNYKGRAYASVGNVHVNKANDAVGSKWEAPYAVTFHESGHAIDFLTKDMAETNGLKLMYSSAYKDGIFPATIREEVEELVNKKDIELKALFKEHETDYGWLVGNGMMSTMDFSYYTMYGKFLSGPPKYSKSYAYAAVEKEIKGLGDGRTYSDLSDMLEGASNGKIKCGYGHGNSYWKKLMGVDEKLGTEAFAEMTSATITNPESLETIKKYLPKSYAIYEDMIADIASKGVKP